MYPESPLSGKTNYILYEYNELDERLININQD